MKFKVEEISKTRLDKYLNSHLEDLTRTQIQKYIKDGFVKIDNKVVIKSGFLVEENQEIILEIPEKEPFKLSIWNNSKIIDIIKETKDYLIINKPKNLIVHPGSGNLDKTLVNILLSMNIELSNINTIRPGIVHRLDKNTSGVMVIAKTQTFHNFIKNQFETNKVKKKYLAIVENSFENSKGLIEAPIGRDTNNRKLFTVTSENSKKALTYFRVIENYKNYALVEFDLVTGRTHQIRVHANFIKHCIVNDPDYGKKNNYGFSDFGQFLHSWKIEFKNLENELVSYEAPVPKEFKELIKTIKENNNGKN